MITQGNPKSPLKSIETRAYRKKIYIGNVSPSITEEQIQQNLTNIYKEEIAAKVIEKVEVFLNQDAWKRQQTLLYDNPGHVIKKSVCVVLHSYPGKSLLDVSLKKTSYPVSMRPAIRPWNGAVPWPEGHEQQDSIIPLDW